MTKYLVVVESPAKAKTIEKYLGKDFKVMASYGHVADLIPKEGAVDPEHHFKMHYQPIERNSRHVEAIAKALKTRDALYLATDPDREGEAIAWHVKRLLEEKKLLQNKTVARIVFHQITKKAVNDALENPRAISMDLVNAQQARRALDYLVGFNLSPLLWKKIRRGLSAGREQSPALRMIVEREIEIGNFKIREFCTIEADLHHKRKNFTGKLTQLNNEKQKQFSIEDAKTAEQVRKALMIAANGELLVNKIEKKQRRRQPAPPFITSTLQQEGVRKLGFTAQKTMRVAQQLYEGIDVGEGAVGLITYMRTDSVVLANEAINEMREYIENVYGKDSLPPVAREFKTKSKNAQEAHEAIRPTSVNRIPADLKSRLSPEQFKLYELIWKRAVACQMKQTIIDKGFMSVYMEGEDDGKDEADEKMLPPMAIGEQIKLMEIRSAQHFTEPPPRYTEATLVKSLEEYGIGRPSTYASIISTLRQREYVEIDNKRFIPTDVGRIVNKFLTDHFTDYVDFDFTAKMEDELDAVSRGELEWVPLLRKFWKPFAKQLKDKEENVSRSEAVQARVLGTDPKSGLPIS